MGVFKKFYGFKVGMGQLFDQQTRRVIPVTAVRIDPCVVSRISNVEKGSKVFGLSLLSQKKDLAQAKQLALESKPDFHLQVEDSLEVEKGKVITFSDLKFEAGDEVAVTGISKGQGFAGVMKRHGFAGGPASHGSKFHRQPGSSGRVRSSGRVFKGRKMPGRMGADKVTVKGLSVVKVDAEINCIFIKGALPGKRNSVLFVSVRG